MSYQNLQHRFVVRRTSGKRSTITNVVKAMSAHKAIRDAIKTMDVTIFPGRQVRPFTDALGRFITCARFELSDGTIAWVYEQVSGFENGYVTRPSDWTVQ